MSLFKLLFQFNPNKLNVITAKSMTPKMRNEIANFLNQITQKLTKGDLDVTPSQLQYLKNQGDEITKYDTLTADRGLGSLKERPTAEIIAPLNFGKAAKTDLKKIRQRVEADKKRIQELADNDQIPTKDIDEPEFKDGGPVDKKDEDTVPLKPDEFDEIFRKMFSEYEWEKKKDSWKDKDYADGGRVEMAAGGLSKLLQMTRRGFLKAAGATGIAAAAGGKLKKAKKATKDLDIVLRKNYDEGYYAGMLAEINPLTATSKKFLDDMVKSKKVVKRDDGSYYVDVDDFTDYGGDVDVFKDIKDKFNYKVYNYKGLKYDKKTGELAKDKKGQYIEDIEEVKDLRDYDSPLTDEGRNYGASSGQFEDDSTEYLADILQPKSVKQQLQDRLKKVELQNRIDAINKKYRQNKADGGVATLFMER